MQSMVISNSSKQEPDSDLLDRPRGVERNPKTAKIIVVDDEPTNIKVVCRLLKLEGYANFITSSDATQAVELVRTELPDLVLLDLMMPGVSGLEILSELRELHETRYIPVIILTASTHHATRIDALHRGANDFLNKPVDPSELAPRVRNVLSLKIHQDQLRNYSRDLEEAVRLRTAQLESSRQDVIHCLARAAEYRDDDTGQHILRVGKYARLIGEVLGIQGEDLDVLEHAAQLHDVGKIGIPDDILLKPGKLTSEEFATMQKHCAYGKHILGNTTNLERQVIKDHANIGASILEIGSSPILEIAHRIALTHHEWWDGTGYPLGLKGEDIPLEGRITAVADVFDALSTKRCYKDAFPLDKCLSIMKEECGTHFDPTVLEAFLQCRKKVVSIQMQYADEE